MAGFNLNDTIGLMMRLLTHHREIINLWHALSDLLVKLGLLPSGAQAVTHSSHNFDVFWVQSSLNVLTGSNLTVDGIMGPVTIAAVKKFQADNGLEADGWVGVLTLAKLEELTQKRRA